MRIVEIDDQDRLWAKLNGIDLDIDSIFQHAGNVLNIMIQLKSAYRNKNLMPIIADAEYRLERIINSNFSNDQSTIELKDKAQKYLLEIQKLKGQL